MPLRALTNGKEFLAWDLGEHHRDVLFDCPICEDQLIPVIPTGNIIKHFRHKNNEAHGEPETPEHLAIKKLVYETFGGSRSCSALEQRIGNHIVDVVAPLGHHGKMLAIECQCSSISENEFRDRNKTYEGSVTQNILGTDYPCHPNYYPYWILGGMHYREQMRNNSHKRRLIERLIADRQTLIYSDGENIYKSEWERGNYGGWFKFAEIVPSRLVYTIHRDWGEEQ